MQKTDENTLRTLHQKGTNLRREAKRVGHKLSLAVSEEEVERLWKQYSQLMSRAREYEEMSGFFREHEGRFRDRTHCKPLFDSAYISLTNELIELYDQLHASKEAKKGEILKQIEEKKRERWEKGSYVSRETGEAVKIVIGKDGKPAFDEPEDD